MKYFYIKQLTILMFNKQNKARNKNIEITATYKLRYTLPNLKVCLKIIHCLILSLLIKN